PSEPSPVAQGKAAGETTKTPTMSEHTTWEDVRTVFSGPAARRTSEARILAPSDQGSNDHIDRSVSPKVTTDAEASRVPDGSTLERVPEPDGSVTGIPNSTDDHIPTPVVEPSSTLPSSVVTGVPVFDVLLGENAPTPQFGLLG